MTGPSKPPLIPAQFIPWLPVAAALLLLLVPTYYDFAHTLWDTEEQGHGPMIIAVSAYYAWTRREAMFTSPLHPRALLGGLCVLVGVLLYVLGRSQGLPYLEAAAPIAVLAGILLVMRGAAALHAWWFPVLFLVFSVPLPNMVVDLVTQPLKNWVSVIAETLLYSAGYPIARIGITLSIGQYQLLVADACSGLNSMFSLSALGVLYLYMMRHTSWLRNLIIIAAILPIAFTANIVRVMVLVLITYHLGDEAGQGFLHGFAGMILFVVALVMLFSLDSLLGLVLRNKPVARPPGERS